MATEIERKFLVDRNHPDLHALLGTKPALISQGYMKSDETGVVRVRIMDDQGFLTIKGPTVGISRAEFEYEIPKEDAESMLASMCDKVLRKQRYTLDIGDGLTLELDVFLQVDLILAEIELPTEDTPFSAPAWLTEDVSEDPAYFNNAIAERL